MKKDVDMSLIQRKIYLDEKTEKIVREHVRDGGFGGKGLSAAIRNIISEWSDLHDKRYILTEKGRQVLLEEISE
jgi:hypothetical protein